MQSRGNAHEVSKTMSAKQTCNSKSLQYSNYHEIPEAVGGKGLLFNRENEEKMEDLFKDAQEAYSNGVSVLVNVLIGRTDFRDGSISV